MVVEVRDTIHGIDHKKYFIGLLYGQIYLLVDFRFKYIIGVNHPSAGIDDGEFLAVPVHFAVLAVARRSGGRIHDCRTRFGQSVEKC